MLRTAASETQLRSAAAYDSSDNAYERGERSARRTSGRRYTSPDESARSTSGRLPSARFAHEYDYVDAPRRSVSDERVREPRNNEHHSRSSEHKSSGKMSLVERFKQKRHEYRKAKAGKQFAAQFKDEPSDASRNAPRAAVYTSSVGTKQRQAMDKQRSSSRSSADAKQFDLKSRIAEFIENLRSPKGLVIGVVAICLVAACVFIYPSARQYYQTVRQNARLEAEYEAIQERNTALQQEVDSLQSSEGIHDRAHELYGWVAAGENSVLVQGIERSTEGKTNGYQATITPDSIPAPETWYSPVLDWFFGYDNSPSN